MNKKLYYRVSELQSSAITKIKSKEVFVKGASFGFKTSSPYISTRIGYSTGIYSYYGQGKTQILIEQLVHLSKCKGWKHVVWLTESGRKDELISDIIQTYMGINFSNPSNAVTDEDLINAYIWADQYFYVIDHEVKLMNIRDIYEITSQIERDEKVKINTVSIDNATNLARERSTSTFMIHEYMNYMMSAINRTSMLKQYHTFILFHVGKPEKMLEKDGIKVLPPPSVFNIVGGQMTNFLGYNLFGVYRPIKSEEQYGFINPQTGIPYDRNETVIIVEKSKPKGVGTEGQFSLFFDKSRSKFYENIHGKRYYSGDYYNEYGENKTSSDQVNTPSMKPSTDFDDSVESPF